MLFIWEQVRLTGPLKLGELVVTHVYYNFTKFHQNQMKNKKSFINSPFFCSEFQSVSRIVKIVHSVMLLSRVYSTFWQKKYKLYLLIQTQDVSKKIDCQSGEANWHSSSEPPPERRVKFSHNGAHNFMFFQYRRLFPIMLSFFQFSISPISKPLANFFVFFLTSLTS